MSDNDIALRLLGQVNNFLKQFSNNQIHNYVLVSHAILNSNKLLNDPESDISDTIKTELTESLRILEEKENARRAFVKANLPPDNPLLFAMASAKGSPMQPQRGGNRSSPRPTAERVLHSGRHHIVYLGPRGGRYIKKKGVFVRL